MDVISSMEAGNAFLPCFVERFDARFAASSQGPDLHRTLNVPAFRLKRYLGSSQTTLRSRTAPLHYDRKQIILERSEVADTLAGQYVDLRIR